MNSGVADGENVAKIVRQNVARETGLMTANTKVYNTRVGTEFAAHETVDHLAKEYARGDVTINRRAVYEGRASSRNPNSSNIGALAKDVNSEHRQGTH